MPPSTSTSARVALDVSELALSTLLNAAQLTPIPYLVNAAGLALSIVNIIQNVKLNRDAYRRLGKDASEIVSSILRNDSRAAQDAAILPPVYLEHTKELSKTLADIHTFIKTQTSRNKALRAIQCKSDAAMIQEYRERLKHSVEVFNIKSTISMHNTLASIQGQLAGIAEQTSRIPLDWNRQPQSSVGAKTEEKADIERVEKQERDRQKLEKKIIEKEKERLERERRTIHGFHHDRPPATDTNPFRRSASSMLDTPDHSFFWEYSVDPFYECPVPLAFPSPFSAPPGLTVPDIYSSSSDLPSLQAGTLALADHGSDSYYSLIPGFAVKTSGDISIYASTVVNSNSGNVTVNNVTNSNNIHYYL